MGLGVLLTALVVVGVRTTVADAVRVSSGSMSPTVCTGDVVLLDRFRPVRGLGTGDIVSFPSPADGTETLKRVVAVGGQRVAIADAVLVVDGQPVTEPYVDAASVDGVYFGPVTVPVGTVFVMGDDRELSIDSRRWGPVDLTTIDGRLLSTVWSSCPS